MVSKLSLLLALVSSLSALAHPVAHHPTRDIRIIGTTQSSILKRDHHDEAPASLAAPEAAPAEGAPASGEADTGSLKVLASGNQAFRNKTDPALLKKLTDEGQSPLGVIFLCSDSRVSESSIFNTEPGTLFTQRNIANQIQPNDPNAESTLAYGVTVLGVKHVIMLGHYGCGGIAASIATPPTEGIDAASAVIQNWIEPVRQTYRSSSRPEIVEHREKNKNSTVVEEPEVNDPAFRALVEENVKLGVQRIAETNIMRNHYARLASESANTTESTPTKRADHHGGGPAVPVFIHGWVYDIENGEVRDLGVTVGPPGVTPPPAPFDVVSEAVGKMSLTHEPLRERGLFARHH